jgi:hypothetical protein
MTVSETGRFSIRILPRKSRETSVALPQHNSGPSKIAATATLFGRRAVELLLARH